MKKPLMATNGVITKSAASPSRVALAHGSVLRYVTSVMKLQGVPMRKQWIVNLAGQLGRRRARGGQKYRRRKRSEE